MTALCSPAYWGTFAAQLIAMPVFGIGAAIWLAREARREAAAALLDPPVPTTDPAHAHRHRECDKGLAEEGQARRWSEAGTQDTPVEGDPEAGLKEALLPPAQRQQQQGEEVQQRGGTDGLGSGSPTLGLLAVYQAFAMLAGLVGKGAAEGSAATGHSYHGGGAALQHCSFPNLDSCARPPLKFKSGAALFGTFLPPQISHVGGLLGLGGGMVTGPLLLELGIHPQASGVCSQWNSRPR